MKRIISLAMLAMLPFMLGAQNMIVTRASTVTLDTVSGVIVPGVMYDIVADTNWCNAPCVVKVPGFTISGSDSIILDAGGRGSVFHIWLGGGTNFHSRLEIQDVWLSEVSSDSNAKKGAWLPVNTTTVAITVGPPSNPNPGDWFGVLDSRAQSGANAITVDFSGAGQKLNGSVTNGIISTNGASVRYTWFNSTIGWGK